MLKKETFIKILGLIIKQEEIDNEVSKAIEKISDTWVLINSKNKYYEALHLCLKEVMNDKDDYIAWYLWEDVPKKVYIKKEAHDISTPEKLYDFLVKYYGTK